MRHNNLKMKKHKRRKKGFTLIELMVTITVIGILATVGMVTYSNAQKSARDARRKDDFKQIATALELYQQANGHFPLGNHRYAWYGGGPGMWSSSRDAAPWIAGLTSTYISQLPVDPLNSLSYNYTYTTGGSDCASPQSYILEVEMENTNDSNAGLTFTDCAGGSNPVVSPFYAVIGN